MKLICPECGSVDVKVVGGCGECREKDCGHVGPKDKFKPTTQAAEHISAPRAKWRDPVAMSMDGYEGK